MQRTLLIFLIFFLSSCSSSKGTQEEANVYRDKGLHEFINQEYDSALYFLDLALEINPEYVAAHANKSDVLTKLGRLDEALIESNLSTSFKGFDATYLMAEAMAYERVQRTTEAKESLMKAISMLDEQGYSNTNEHFLIDRAICTAFTKGKKEALVDLEKIIKTTQDIEVGIFAKKLFNELSVSTEETYSGWIIEMNEFKGENYCIYSPESENNLIKQLTDFGINPGAILKVNDSLVNIHIRKVFESKAIEFGLEKCNND